MRTTMLTHGEWERRVAETPNADRLRIWGPAPAIETTFAGRQYVLSWGAQQAAVTLVNRYPFRHHPAYGATHARAVLSLARELDVDTHTAGLIALWVAPSRCGIDHFTTPPGRIRILSRDEEWAWQAGRAVARHAAEVAANGGYCDTWSHRNNRVCPIRPDQP